MAVAARVKQCTLMIAQATSQVAVHQDKLNKANHRFVNKQILIDNDNGDEVELNHSKQELIREINTQRAALRLVAAQLKRWQLKLDEVNEYGSLALPAPAAATVPAATVATPALAATVKLPAPRPCPDSSPRPTQRQRVECGFKWRAREHLECV